MRSYRYRLLDVFTDVPLGGNQLAVFPEADGLDADAMQQIARELNLSESAFAFRRAGDLEWRLRIFTPGVENPFAGHPTIGAAIVLARECGVEHGTLILHEQVGKIPVSVQRGATVDRARLTLPSRPRFGPSDVSTADLAGMLGLDAADILDGAWRPLTVDCGIPYYIIPVRSLDAARRCSLRLDRWERLLADHWAPHVYVVTLETERADADIHVRMFPPAMGVSEDPATGSAAAALAGLLARVDGGSGARRWAIEQGLELGRPSLIELFADLDDGVAVTVSVAGGAICVGEGEIEMAA
jgi:trans-2,3-dihydro-3-hydroxyanthranilate isomerase